MPRTSSPSPLRSTQRASHRCIFTPAQPDYPADCLREFISGAYKGDRIQTEPPKGHFLDPELGIASPRRRERGKAAILPGGRRAAEGQFFQYEMLEQGAAWVAWLDADDADDLDAAANLLDGAVLQLGRSKRREYGGEVTVSVERHWAPPMQSNERDGEVVIWCLSDLALVDAFGGVDLAPEVASFGIPGFRGRLDRTRSLISTRRYAPFNGYLRARDREHAVIEAGSVLVYADAYCPEGAFSKPVGLWRERGLGIVWANSPLLDTKGKIGRVSWRQDQLQSMPQHVAPPFKAPLQPGMEANSALLSVLRVRANALRDAKSDTTAADALYDSLYAQIEDAVAHGDDVPTASQWSRVSKAASIATNLNDLRDALFNTRNGICQGAANKEWHNLGKVLRTLIDNTSQRPQALGTDDALCPALQRAARKISASVKRETAR